MEYDLFLNWFKNYHIDKKKSEEDFLKNKEYLLPRILWHRLTGLFYYNCGNKIKNVNEIEMDCFKKLALTVTYIDIYREIKKKLEKDKLEFIVIKGIYFIENNLYHPMERPVTDIDIIINKKDWMKAIKSLSEIGFFPYKDKNKITFFHALPLVDKSNSYQIELHQNIDHKFQWNLPYSFFFDKEFSIEKHYLLSVIHSFRHRFEDFLFFEDILRIINVDNFSLEKAINLAKKYRIEKLEKIAREMSLWFKGNNFNTTDTMKFFLKFSDYWTKEQKTKPPMRRVRYIFNRPFYKAAINLLNHSLKKLFYEMKKHFIK